MTRKAASSKEVSLTKLEGVTVAINAPDAQSYEMDVTLIFPLKDPLTLFAAIPEGANHVVIGSHAGVENRSDNKDVPKLCLWVAGASQSMTVDMSNVRKVFETLKSKVAPNCIIWIGGCNIGANKAFCEAASEASGCPVVAPELDLVAKKYPKGYIDMLDRVAMTKVYTGKNLISPSDLCVRQELHKFVVPV